MNKVFQADHKALRQVYSDVREAKQVAERQLERLRSAPLPSKSGEAKSSGCLPSLCFHGQPAA